MYARHLCMAISNCTYYESLVTSNPVKRELGVSETGMVTAPMGPGVGLEPGPHYPDELTPYVFDMSTGAAGSSSPAVTEVSSN
jgi:hypothetical protein